jgi:hypothetical protein
MLGGEVKRQDGPDGEAEHGRGGERRVLPERFR